MKKLSLESLLKSWRRADSLCFVAIMLLAAVLRFSHLDVAHFQLDQAKSAQLVWDWARGAQLPTHYFFLTGGYSNFPLPLYLWAPAFLVSSHIQALLAWNILLNLGALVLCWHFVRHYWGWRIAALATLLFAASPWHAFYSHRIWSNAQTSIFVMLWLIATVCAFHERRRRFWSLSWGTAILLLQIHASGAFFLLLNIPLWIGAGGKTRSWRWAAGGILLALIPALPWIIAHLQGDLLLAPERFPFVGEGKRALAYNIAPLLEILTTNDWRQWFRGERFELLEMVFRPLELFVLPLVMGYAAGIIHICWRGWRGPDRRLHIALALWLIAPIIAFPFVSYEPYALVYYIPLLPAPFIALALLSRRVNGIWRRLYIVLIALVCAAQAYAVWGSARYIRAQVARDDETVWSVGGGEPLSMQMAIADAARESVQNGEASEAFVLSRPVIVMDIETLAHAMPLLSGLPMRWLDQGKPHLVFPSAPSAWIMDVTKGDWLPHYPSGVESARSGPFRLYWLPGKAAPAPRHELPSRPAYANGVQLLGYDGLRCAGGWRLHWSPGPASEDDATRTHFFVNLLGADEANLAQRDLAAYDARAWRPGDHIVTSFDFDQDLRDLPIEMIRVGMYRFSLATNAYLDAVYALDAAGNPWLYAVDMPFSGACQDDGS